QWDLVCKNRWISFTITTVQMTGALIGGFIVGHLGDRFGRKTSLYTMLLMHAVFVAVSAFSNSWQLLAAVRFAIGVTGGSVTIVGFPASIEFVGKRWRALISALPVWSATAPFVALLPTSFLIAAILNILFVEHVGPPMLMPLIWSIVPESIRWLAVKGRTEEASKVARRIAKRNNKTPPDTAIVVMIAEEERTLNSNLYGYSFIDLLRCKRLA
ncbi:hypothetical protein LOTGIDRAFT_117866, partial [Lottia gigantea]